VEQVTDEMLKKYLEGLLAAASTSASPQKLVGALKFDTRIFFWGGLRLFQLTVFCRSQSIRKGAFTISDNSVQA